MMVNQCKSTRLKLKERKEWDHGEKGSIPQVKTVCSWTLGKRRESGAGEMHEATLTKYFPKTTKDARFRKLRDQQAREVPKNQTKQF